MRRLEQQTSDILNVMYDSVTNQNFDRVSDDTDRVSGVVDDDSAGQTLTIYKCPMTMIMTLPQEK